jgi:NitT/TauT family transport system ATP-binding protein
MVSGMSTANLPLRGMNVMDVPLAIDATHAVAAAASTAIHVDNVSVTYPVGRGGSRTVLENISLKIEEGECVVLLGETGCGKSTLLRMLLGQERPTSGSISVAGSAVQRVDSRSAYVPQRYSLFPNLTVLENLTMGPLTSRYHTLGRLLPSFREYRREVREEAMRQLSHMGLQASDAAKYPHQLSGGMQQRVAIAQALMMKSRVLLMDEAFSALDPATRSSLQRLLRTVWTESKPTIVFVTHNTAEALFLGTRVVVLARKSREDHCGSHVALDMKLSSPGMSFNNNGQQFLDLVEHVESFSRGNREAILPNAFLADGDTQ